MKRPIEAVLSRHTEPKLDSAISGFVSVRLDCRYQRAASITECTGSLLKYYYYLPCDGPVHSQTQPLYHDYPIDR